MSWNVPQIWKDGTCWIVGGGASITSQFHIPKKLVKRVYDKEAPISEYSSYMSQLHDKHVIGVNGAFQLGDWVDICFFGDKPWYFDNAPALSTYKGILVGCAEFLAVPGWQQLGIKHLQKSVIPYGITEKEGEVCWNYNSGAAAINLAYHLGCKRIILLGFDMALSLSGTGHWHNLYDGKTNMPFERHLVGFDSIATDAKKLGLEIINASPLSKITQFPKINVDQIEL